jgi:hypothetical protein
MLRNSSMSIMMILVAASLIGISTIHQNAEGQTPPKRAVGDIVQLTTYAPVAGCIAVVTLSNVPNELGLKPGAVILLFSERESNCVLLGMSKMTNYGPIAFEALKMTVSSLPPIVRVDINRPANFADLYRMFSVDVS